MARERKSDRWITPGVIIAGILVAGLVACVVAAGVTYLAARGIDPDPMLQLVASVTTSVGVLGNLLLQLAGRTTQAKVERNTGQLTSVVAEVIDAVVPPPLDDDQDGDDAPATAMRANHAALPQVPRRRSDTR